MNTFEKDVFSSMFFLLSSFFFFDPTLQGLTEAAVNLAKAYAEGYFDGVHRGKKMLSVEKQREQDMSVHEQVFFPGLGFGGTRSVRLAKNVDVIQ